MRRPRFPWKTGLLVTAWTLVLVCAAPLAAQQDDPFDAEPAAEAPADDAVQQDAPAAADDPFDAPEPDGFDEPVDEKPAPAEKPAADEPTAEPKPAVPQSPAVQAVLESHPRTPFEYLRAIRILADLGHAPLAQPLVEALKKQQLDDAAKAKVLGQFDSAQLMRLARNPELAEALAPFIDELFRGAAAYRRDPARLAEWTRQLNDADEAARARATLALTEAGEAAVAPLLAVLADPGRAAEHRRAQRMLVALGDRAIAPLLGALEAPDAALVAQVIEVLGALRATEAVEALLFPLTAADSGPPLRAAAGAALARISGHVPERTRALQLLEYAARRHLQRSRDEAGDHVAAEAVWHWDADREQSLPHTYSQSGAELDAAVRRAADLYELDPAHPQHRDLYLTALLEAAQMATGLGTPLPTGAGTAYAVAAALGPDAVESVLTRSLEEGYLPAATAASQILGDIGSPALLAHGGAAPSALARAAGHADRRLRFAAIAAIMKLHASERFAGSSHVTEGLEFFARSYGTPRMLIAHPLSAEASTLAGLAASLGYQADTATSGRQAYELAVGSPDYELVLIHSEIKRPAADELLAQLRRDRRTALLPVGFAAPVDDLERVERFARRAGRAEAFLQPQKPEEMRLVVGDVLAHAGRGHVTTAERRAQALAALQWLIELAQSGQRVFAVTDLERAIVPLLYVPETAPRAVELLGEIGTDAAQRALVELAGSPTQPRPLRDAAVVALARGIRRHGILLTSDEILYQYELYNANAGSDAETHQVLGAVLDVIETKGNPGEPS